VQYSLDSSPDFPKSTLDAVASVLSLARNMLHQAGLSPEFQALCLQSLYLMCAT
jgi:hypothetical protein